MKARCLRGKTKRSFAESLRRRCPTLSRPRGQEVLAFIALAAWMRLAGSYRVVVVDGESMLPSLHHGDAIVAARLPYGVADTVVAALPDGSYVVKQVKAIRGSQVDLVGTQRHSQSLGALGQNCRN